jgi:hypothetical protein
MIQDLQIKYLEVFFYSNLISMPTTLPNAATANTNSNATIAALTAAAQANFIASTTVLINQAINNGLFQVQPFMVPLVTSAYIISYFQTLGYTVLFPIIPSGPYEFCFAPAGFPEVLGNNWTNWSCNCGRSCGPIRIQISWT